MSADSEPEQVSCSFDELKSGKQFNAGHGVVLIVSGIKGTKLNLGKQDDAADEEDSGGAKNGAKTEAAGDSAAAGDGAKTGNAAAGGSDSTEGGTGDAKTGDAATAKGADGSGSAGPDAQPAGQEEAEPAKQDEDGNVTGTLQGPGGPLKAWPFVLKKDGAALDDKGLGSGSTQNTFKNGKWFSDSSGAYKFEKMAKATYVVDLFLPGGKLEPVDDQMSVDSGDRRETPAPIDQDVEEVGFANEEESAPGDDGAAAEA
jgi:hypothetical protein